MFDRTTEARWALRVINVVLGLAGLANVTAGTVFLVRGNSVPGSASVAAGIVLLLIATIDRFESVKGMGVEAKLRRVDEKLAEADHLLTQVREVAELTGAELLELASRVGRWDSAPSHQHLFELAEAIRRRLLEVGSVDEKVRSVLAPWCRIVALDLARKLFEPLRLALVEQREKLQDDQKSVPKSAPDANERVQDYVQRMQAVSSAEAAANRSLVKIAPENMRQWLRDAVENAPELSDDAKRLLMSDLATWDEELSALAECRVSNPQRLLSHLS